MFITKQQTVFLTQQIKTLIYIPLNTLDLNYFMFEGRIFTINPHSMLIDLKPFVIFAPIPMN